jgi:hypothetical protein
MSIKIIPETKMNISFWISKVEADLVTQIKKAFGRVAAVRVARAFAKSDLKSAIEYVDSIGE